MKTPDMLGTRELRRIFRCNPKTVLRWIRLGMLAGATRDERKRWCIPIATVTVMRKRAGVRRAGYGPFGPRRGGVWYSPDERALLESTMSHAEVATRLGRSVKAVSIQRCRMRRQAGGCDAVAIARARRME
jgi:hypothetical protein